MTMTTLPDMAFHTEFGNYWPLMDNGYTHSHTAEKHVFILSTLLSNELRMMHWKNKKIYTVIGLALCTLDNALYVLYHPEYPCAIELFARPASMFFGLVGDTTIPRIGSRTRFIPRVLASIADVHTDI